MKVRFKHSPENGAFLNYIRKMGIENSFNVTHKRIGANFQLVYHIVPPINGWYDFNASRFVPIQETLVELEDML